MEMLPAPYCPGCKTLAKDMGELDFFLEEGQTREEYVRQEEGTYNEVNGHFLCDTCYTKEGMPTSPTGWKCP